MKYFTLIHILFECSSTIEWITFFFRFPLGDAELLQKWIAAMNVKDFVANKKSLLCSDHFEKGCFRKRNSQPNNVRLKENAVPTVFTLPQTKGKINVLFLSFVSLLEYNAHYSKAIITFRSTCHKTGWITCIPNGKMCLIWSSNTKFNFRRTYISKSKAIDTAWRAQKGRFIRKSASFKNPENWQYFWHHGPFSERKCQRFRWKIVEHIFNLNLRYCWTIQKPI